ncbi:hypothetical protein SDRG_10165 [Saprolegnia diclina VS20]|uniref:Uncharacterized protein n=1 Tax=Saprolegnia diclina (strain VS20) TaxID=1156394 RepID=T0QFR1_SAPDV|nr:hypothetical protein SDRG_10165 [Saprolegnia diclina VS20]EQC32425.1 hypothetical protein SDRG_10165 [Saprolegnia diclina VS20]|eukprot:XP_008614366.1 hypothetical protein SDRG_10165 [Saprolegnia diclina VS20]
MVARAFSAGVLVAAAGYLSTRALIEERTADALLRIDAMRTRVNPPVRRATTKKPLPRHAVEHEYYTNVRESWNSRVLAFRGLVLDAVKQTNRSNDVVDVLRDQLHRRTQLLDDLRTAYMHDVIVVRDRLFAHGLDPDEALRALPSIDLTPHLPLFSPTNAALRISPCKACGGSVVMLRTDDEALKIAADKVAALEAQVGSLRHARIEADAAAAAATTELAQMQRMFLKEQAAHRSVGDAKKRLEAKLVAMGTRVAEATQVAFDLKQQTTKTEAIRAAHDVLAKALGTTERARDAALLQCAATRETLATAKIELSAAQEREADLQGRLHQLEATHEVAKQRHDQVRLELHQMTQRVRLIEEQTKLTYLVELNVLTRKLGEARESLRRLQDTTSMQLEDYAMRLSPLAAALAIAHETITQLNTALLAQTEVASRASIDEQSEHERVAATSASALALIRAECQDKLEHLRVELAITKRALCLQRLRYYFSRTCQQLISFPFVQLLRHTVTALRERLAFLLQAQATKDIAMAHTTKELEQTRASLQEHLRDVTETNRSLARRVEELSTQGKAQRTETYTAQRRTVELQVQTAQQAAELEVRALALVQAQNDADVAAMTYEDCVASLLRRRESQLQAFVLERQHASIARHALESRLDDASRALQQVQTEHGALRHRYAKCYKRLKMATETAKAKTNAVGELADDLALYGNHMCALEAKLAAETRRGTMYVEMVDNLTKVLHEQTQEEVVLHQRLHRLERASSTDALDFEAARRVTAAKVVQCAWRAKRVRAKHALTIGIQRQKLTLQLASLQASQDAAVQGLHWLAAAEANASTLQTLGVDASFLADAPRWDDAKREAAAISIQSAWRCRRAKRGRLPAPLGSPQRIAREQHDRAQALRQASRHESLVALDVAKLHMQKLAACGVRIT